MTILQESSVSRVWEHISEHDTGFISAWRDRKDCNSGEPFSRKEKQENDRKLRAYLQTNGYGITRIHGSYVENFGNAKLAKNVSEDSYFVVDKSDSGNLKNDLVELGQYFDQDSILFIPQGGEGAVLVGTNECEGGYPGLGNEVQVGKLAGGDSEFYSRVGSRAFKFESKDIDQSNLEPGSMGGKWARKKLAEVFEAELKAYKAK